MVAPNLLRAVIALIVGLAIHLVLPDTAWSQDCSGDVQELAEEGTALFRDGEYGDAARAFESAYACDPVPVLLYNIARAYQRGGRCVIANGFFQRYLESGDGSAIDQVNEHAPGQAACATEYRDLVQQANVAIDQRDLDQAAALIEAAIALSDEPEARMLLGDVMFFRGEFEASQAHLERLSEAADLTDEQRDTITRNIERAERSIATASCTEEQEGCREERERIQFEYDAEVNDQRQLGWIVAGAGGGLFLIAIIHDAVGAGTIDEYEQAAVNGDASSFDDLRDDIESAQTVSWVLYGLSSATIVTGVIVALTAGGYNAADDMNCDDLCWNWGVGLGSAEVGLRF